jgi:ABC-2 type transport system permease protein
MSVADSAPSKVSGRLLRSELRLMCARRRNIAGLVVLCVVPVILAVVVAVTRPTGGDGPPFFSVLFGNGLFIVLLALTVESAVFLPLAVSILAGDAIAGEANIGTLRYLLTVPVGRTRLLLVKFAALVIGAAALVAAVSLVSAIAGLALFGTGDLVTVSATTIGFGDSVGRVAVVCGYVALTLIPVCAIGLFLSTVTEQPTGAAVATLMWVVLDQILGAISALDWLHPFLLTNHWAQWGDLLRDPAGFGGIGLGALSAAGYTAVFVTAGWARLTTKDITS